MVEARVRLNRPYDEFGSSIYSQELILTNASGKENGRVMGTTNLEGDDKNLISLKFEQNTG